MFPSLVSDTASYGRLADLAEALEDRLETVAAVREAKTWAYPERELRVALDFRRLAELKLRAADVLNAVSGENTNLPGGPVEVDISKLEPGEMKIIEWRGKPVWVVRRTKEMLASLKTVAARLTDPGSKDSAQPEYAKNEHRARKAEFMVMEGVCTHLGCSPELKGAEAKAEMGGDWAGGFYCVCHGSKFDFAGRVFKGAPAPLNLPVPPHSYLSETTLLIGEDKKEA